MGQKSLFNVPELEHFMLDQHNDIDPLLPNQLPTTTRQVTELSVGLNLPIKLAVDAFPGCGGIAWPAGCVSAPFLPNPLIFLFRFLEYL